ncbi:MAG: hypothetical protein KBT31_01810 [Firmicutes bacterium]|nr:hypothetical protein [Candidatus Colimorpha enterica]
MKRHIAIILSFLLIFSFISGCSGPQSQPSDTSTSETQSCKDTEPIPEKEADVFLNSISVDGVPLEGFRRDKQDYTFDFALPDGYPTVTAEPDGQYETETVQPSKATDGKAVITVLDGSGGKRTYTVAFIPAEAFEVKAETILPGGADGALSFVCDDGKTDTANKMKKYAEEYDFLTASFAIPTRDLATFSMVSNEYMIDKDGNFSIRIKSPEAKFWRDLIKEGGGRFSINSHGHAHAYWGVDDSGTGGFPKFNTLKEVTGSKQIIKKVFDIDSLAMINPGITAPSNEYFPYFKKLVMEHYYGMRTGKIDAPNTPKYFNFRDLRYDIGSNVIFDRGQMSPEKYAQSWNDYIDSQTGKGGWAVFCIHCIYDDSRKIDNDYTVKDSEMRIMLDHVRDLGENKIWCATFDEVMKYYFELSSLSLAASVIGKDDGITVTLTDREDDEAFDSAILVKLTVPATWDKAFIGEDELEITEGEDGTRYVVAPAVPDRGDITVSPVLTVNS